MIIQLREVRREDAAQLVGLLDQLGYPTDLTAVHERLDYWLGDPSSSLLGAADNQGLVGVAALHLIPMLEVTGRFARLVALVVDDRYRGQGIGRQLVTAAEEQARAAGCVKLEVTSSSRRGQAHAFYRDLGYEDLCASSARFIKNLA
jgi:GNAT superfamily N-acetyltransferase